MGEPLAPLPAAPMDAQDVERNKDLAALSYLWVFSLVVYALKKESPFVRFHARQAIVLFLVSLPLWFIPYAGRVLELFLLALAFYGFVAAAQGERRELPFIGPLSRGKLELRSSWKQCIDGFLRLHRFVRGALRNDHPEVLDKRPSDQISSLRPKQP